MATIAVAHKTDMEIMERDTRTWREGIYSRIWCTFLDQQVAVWYSGEHFRLPCVGPRVQFPAGIYFYDVTMQ